MDNIHKFSSYDLIEQEASEWLVRLDGDKAPTSEELRALKEWINKSPVHRQQLTRLAKHWDNANILIELSNHTYYKSDSISGLSFWNSFHHRKWGANWQSAVVAICILLVGLAFGFGLFQDNMQMSVAGNGLYETRIGEQNTITLADRSIIELNTNSRIQVDYTNNRRSVTLLQGEAHFEVSKDISRPFEVSAGNGKVIAVGTAFAVRLNHEALKVTVTEGKVALEALRQISVNNEKQTSVKEYDISDGKVSSFDKVIIADEKVGYLEAGQTVEFEPLKNTKVDDMVEILEPESLEQKLAWRRGLLLFAGEPLTEVVQEINRYTNVKIEIKDPDIANIRIGGQFKVGETEAMLKVLALNFDVEAKFIDNNTIYLNKSTSIH